MKWFYKWLGKKIAVANNGESGIGVEESIAAAGSINYAKVKASRRLGVSSESDLSSEPIQFKMYKASGGWAIEFRHYDSNTDRVHTSLYVVSGEEELGNNISQIITMEALKR